VDWYRSDSFCIGTNLVSVHSLVRYFVNHACFDEIYVMHKQQLQEDVITPFFVTSFDQRVKLEVNN